MADASDSTTAPQVVVFVTPSDRGHFDYTVFIAEELHKRGYAIEYWSPSMAASNAPDFATFHALHEAGDNRFDRFTRAYCAAHIVSGDTYQETKEGFEKKMVELLVAEFGSTEKAMEDVQGTRDALVRMKQRVLQKDVALCIFDGVHMHAWMGQHCKDHGVPSMSLRPTQVFIRHPENEVSVLPDYLGVEPEYQPVRNHRVAVPHPVVYTLLPDLLKDCEIPQGHRNVGPVLPANLEVPSAQEDRFTASGLRAWCDADDAPILYVSFGSMLRGGSVAGGIAKRLLEAIANGPWRILIAAAPELLQGCIEALPQERIRAEAWVPQSAVLAHPNVHAFVSHCGATSMNEAVLHAVPVVAMPFFDDQFFNAASAVANGIAAAELPKHSFTAEAAQSAVRAALGEDARGRIREASKRLRALNGLGEAVAAAEAAIQAARDVE